MPTKPSTAVVAPALVLILVALVSPPEATFTVSGLGSGSTVAVSYATATVCGIVAGERTQRIQCYRGGQSVYVQHQVSYEAIAGGQSFFCGLRSGGLTLLCWDTGFSNPASFHPKRIYHSQTDRLADLTVGDKQVCASKNNTGAVTCWRGGHIQGDGDGGEQSFPSPSEELKFSVMTSGSGFSCGILIENGRVVCWGDRGIGAQIEREFSDFSMSSLMAGENHACGLNTSGVLICRGNNDTGQLDVPSNSPPFVYSGLALGAHHTCAIRRRNGLLVCWGWSGWGGGGGGGGGGSSSSTNFTAPAVTDESFESIVAGSNFTCGLKTRSLTLVCWGPGWPQGAGDLPLPMVIPGPCVEAGCTTCACGVYPNSGTLCYGLGLICKSCDPLLPFLLPLPTNPPRLPPLPHSSDHVPPSSLASDGGNNSLGKAFAAVGAVGAFSGICVVVYVLWTKLGGGVLQRHTQQVYGSAESTCLGIKAAGDLDSDLEASRSAAAAIRRSSNHGSAAERAQKFDLQELSVATHDFSPQHRIGSGSFGSVYRGTLADGREVAIKRRETCARGRKREFQDKEAAFDAEVGLLSRLHHKHLVGLVGFCNQEEERLVVYEYMSNGSLFSHLHAKCNSHKTSSFLNSWNMRIKIALDAARGIEYLHTYAVPPIIHRDIKSSNILLDANWTGKVSDFGLSLLMRPECDDPVPTRAVGTVGYIDPESYVLNVLTTKSDVYGLGVVLLELLTGKRAVFKNEDDDDDDGGGGVPMGVVEYAVPRIAAEEVESVLDPRIGPPTAREAEAVELVAYTAVQCVSLEVRERPTMTHIVAILERALASWEDSHGHASTMSTASVHER